MATTTKATTGTAGRATEKTWSIPLIGHLPPPTQFKIAGSLMLAMLVGSAVSGTFYARNARVSAMEIQTATQMLTDSQRIAKSAALSVRGDEAAFKVLKDSAVRFDDLLKVLKNGGTLSGVDIAKPDASAEAIIGEVQKSWASANVEVEKLVNAKVVLSDFSKAIGELNALDETFLASAKDLVASIEASALSTARHKAVAKSLPFLTQRMGKNVNALAASQEVNLAAAFLLGKDVSTYKSVIEALRNGSNSMGIEAIEDPAVKSKLQANSGIYQKYADQVGVVERNQADLARAKGAFVNAATISEALAAACDNLQKFYEGKEDKNRVVLFLGFAFFALFLLSITTLFKIFADQGNASVRAADVERENQNQQQAIMTLLDEIGELADGNLTVKATVNDSMTGAIADSLNFTVAELRQVIQNVVKSANKVGASADVSSGISNQLASAAREQFERLAKTGDSIIKMSMNMDEIAQETSAAAKASRQSLDVSKDGLRIVEETIERMNTIRDTIQETSKKIKLLGESSTAIGEVTGLIRDITKQINILALNAAIQAASAGEAGRGFAVVAGEVQRLALSSADAARRIDDLVLTIQEDAKGAVSAMELSTREVVEGAKLTDKAGSALKEIEGSVSGLAKAIEEVTNKVEFESETASNLSLDMRLLQEYTEKTVDDSKKGADSVEQVKGIADELRESVAKFRV